MEGLTRNRLRVAGSRLRQVYQTVSTRLQARATLGRFGCVAALPVLLAGVTGCFSVKIRPVEKTVIIDHVQDATLDQLMQSLQDNFEAIQTINARVEVTATTGGAHQGEVHEIPTFAGFIFLRKPSDLRVLLQLPVLHSVALDMVSDGKNFKLKIPPKNKAVTGPAAVTTPSSNGFENLRPNIIRDALLVPPLGPDDYVALTKSSRIMPSPTKKHETIEEPDYDITVLRQKKGHVLGRVRVIHVGRADLRPYEQDIYGDSGRIVTEVHYSRYTRFGDIWFPTLIDLSRPIDEYTLKLDMTKVVLNQKLDDETFVLSIPEGMPIQKM